MVRYVWSLRAAVWVYMGGGDAQGLKFNASNLKQTYDAGCCKPQGGVSRAQALLFFGFSSSVFCQMLVIGHPIIRYDRQAVRAVGTLQLLPEGITRDPRVRYTVYPLVPWSDVRHIGRLPPRL